VPFSRPRGVVIDDPVSRSVLGGHCGQPLIEGNAWVLSRVTDPRPGRLLLGRWGSTNQGFTMPSGSDEPVA
jgi:hypothetical protein